MTTVSNLTVPTVKRAPHPGDLGVDDDDAQAITAEAEESSTDSATEAAATEDKIPETAAADESPAHNDAETATTKDLDLGATVTIGDLDLGAVLADSSMDSIESFKETSTPIPGPALANATARAGPRGPLSGDMYNMLSPDLRAEELLPPGPQDLAVEANNHGAEGGADDGDKDGAEDAAAIRARGDTEDNMWQLPELDPEKFIPHRSPPCLIGIHRDYSGLLIDTEDGGSDSKAVWRPRVDPNSDIGRGMDPFKQRNNDSANERKVVYYPDHTRCVPHSSPRPRTDPSGLIIWTGDEADNPYYMGEAPAFRNSSPEVPIYKARMASDTDKSSPEVPTYKARMASDTDVPDITVSPEKNIHEAMKEFIHGINPSNTLRLNIISRR